MLDRGMPYASGPAWLAEQVLKDRHVLAVAGTHGKTTTSSMLAWILEHAGRNPGFLIGGVPSNFDATARLGAAPYFVIEADEYDTAFFDKRAKFVHYRPRTAILNNLEYDHADIYPDVASIRAPVPPAGAHRAFQRPSHRQWRRCRSSRDLGSRVAGRRARPLAPRAAGAEWTRGRDSRGGAVHRAAPGRTGRRGRMVAARQAQRDERPGGDRGGAARRTSALTRRRARSRRSAA